jgi:hypothetical protein
MENFKNILGESLQVSDYYTEYLQLINYYTNFKRKSIFVDYYNMDTVLTESNDMKATEDKHFKSVKYNLYMSTPLINTWSMVNNTINKTTGKGQLYLAL